MKKTLKSLLWFIVPFGVIASFLSFSYLLPFGPEYLPTFFGRPPSYMNSLLLLLGIISEPLLLLASNNFFDILRNAIIITFLPSTVLITILIFFKIILIKTEGRTGHSIFYGIAFIANTAAAYFSLSGSAAVFYGRQLDPLYSAHTLYSMMEEATMWRYELSILMFSVLISIVCCFVIWLIDRLIISLLKRKDRAGKVRR
jgi:hypothetical protein